jgi:hypothetical protein
MARHPSEHNRMNSQEWSAYFQREEQERERSGAHDALDSVIEMLEAGRFDPSDPRLERLRRLLAGPGRS